MNFKELKNYMFYLYPHNNTKLYDYTSSEKDTANNRIDYVTSVNNTLEQ